MILFRWTVRKTFCNITKCQYIWQVILVPCSSQKCIQSAYVYHGAYFPCSEWPAVISGLPISSTLQGLTDYHPNHLQLVVSWTGGRNVSVSLPLYLVKNDYQPHGIPVYSISNFTTVAVSSTRLNQV